MTRILLTYESLHQLLKAESRLKGEKQSGFHVRPTPTPAGLTDSVCGMALEILVPEQKEPILRFLQNAGLDPAGIHSI
ncbi:MAG: putative Se/S carrier-like protein [Candidatus Obscuribacterales bacterium]